jgi:hypothetical protein
LGGILLDVLAGASPARDESGVIYREQGSLLHQIIGFNHRFIAMKVLTFKKSPVY